MFRSFTYFLFPLLVHSPLDFFNRHGFQPFRLCVEGILAIWWLGHGVDRFVVLSLDGSTPALPGSHRERIYAK